MNQEPESSTLRPARLTDQNLALPNVLTPDYLISKCEYFSSIGIWPRREILDPERWLENFVQDELEHAVYLLNGFMYFSPSLVDQTFSTAIRNLGRMMTKDQWKVFLTNILVTLVTGEDPNVTDSGYAFTRRARRLGIPQDRIVEPQRACNEIRAGFNGAVVFVDDFLGSGNQFDETWNRRYFPYNHSFMSLAATSHATFYYCPAFGTQLGLDRINRDCPEVTVNPGVFIPDRYGALDPDSIIWPSHLRDSAEEFLRTVSVRAGIPDTGGTEPTDWRGFASLGLTIAFENSIPDATLPILYWDDNGWRPLMRRSA